MKKLFIGLAAVAAMAGSGLIYPATMEAVRLEQDSILLQTADGELYAIADRDGIIPGDLVSCIVWSNGTPTPEDDVIISARASGYYFADPLE